MEIFNTIDEVENELKHILTDSDKLNFLKKELNFRRYAVKKALTVTDLTETKTGRIFKGMYEFDDDLITSSLKMDEVLRFIEIEIEFLENKLAQPLEEKSEPHPQQKTEIEPFNPEIFKDQNSYDLFLFLIDRYATTKQPKQFSQIFHWMQENDNSIKPNTGVKFREFVVKRFPEMVAKFSKIEEKKTYEMTTLNGKLKEFNSLNKV